jgi:hypothetical protein
MEFGIEAIRQSIMQGLYLILMSSMIQLVKENMKKGRPPMTKLIASAMLLWGLVLALGAYVYILNPAMKAMAAMAANVPK